MASVAWEIKLKEAQELTDLGAKSEFANDYSTAFNSYVRAGETYLWLIRQDGVRIDRDRLKAAAQKVLGRAETIKQVKKEVKVVERSILSGAEQERALEAGGLVDSIKAPIWREEHSSAASAHPYTLPSLAPKQIEGGARYLQRSDKPSWYSSYLYDPSRSLRGRQIVQRVVTDCSFVAALEVAAEHDYKWGTKVSAKLIAQGCHLLGLISLLPFLYSWLVHPFILKTLKATPSGVRPRTMPFACLSMVPLAVCPSMNRYHAMKTAHQCALWDAVGKTYTSGHPSSRKHTSV